MTSLAYSRTFSCTPERLFDHLEDPAKIVQWMTGVIEDRPTSPGPTRVGSTFTMKIKEGRKISENQGRVTHFERPRRLSVAMSGGCFPEGMEMAIDYRLEPVSGTATRLDYTCAFEPKGFFLRLMALLFPVMGKLMVKGFFKNLARLVEAPAEAPSTAPRPATR